MLTQWYERCSRYYTVSATEEEKRLTMLLFQKIFDALASRVCRLVMGAQECTRTILGI